MKVHDRVVFLDIDGVLQPRTQKRFDYRFDIPDLARELEARCGGKHLYSKMCNTIEMDYMDLAAVFYDWDYNSVERLRYALDVLDAKIVLSTNWREFHCFRSMAALLGVHGLDDYLCDATESYERLRRSQYLSFPRSGQMKTSEKRRSFVRELSMKAMKDIDAGLKEAYAHVDPESSCVAYRTVEIREYLDRHPEITSYVAIDDQNLALGLDGHFVSTSNVIESEHLEKILDILSRRDGPYPLPKACLTKNVERLRREALPLEEEEWFGFDPAREIK